MIDRLLPVVFAAASGLLLIGAIVQEMHGFLRAKVAAGPEKSDQVDGGMQRVFSSGGGVLLFGFVVSTFVALVKNAGWDAGLWWLVVPIGLVFAFFAFCGLSIPIGHLVWRFRFREEIDAAGNVIRRRGDAQDQTGD